MKNTKTREQESDDDERKKTENKNYISGIWALAVHYSIMNTRTLVRFKCTHKWYSQTMSINIRNKNNKIIYSSSLDRHFISFKRFPLLWLLLLYFRKCTRFFLFSKRRIWPEENRTVKTLSVRKCNSQNIEQNNLNEDRTGLESKLKKENVFRDMYSAFFMKSI